MKVLEVLPENEAPQLTFILFHGYGADAYDLQSLAEVITPPVPTQFLFPQGVIAVPIGPGWTGRAWWPIDIEALQLAASRGEPRDLSKEKPAALPELRKKMFTWIESLRVPWNQIVLGGFSQGSMLATDLFLHAPEAPKALVVLSGALVNKDEWKTVAAKRSGAPFFLSHGKMDAVLDHRGGAQLETFLCQNGLKGKLMSFQGSHEIPMEVIVRLNEFLQQVAK
ncbi:MAG: serine esterase [Bdellovibrio sp. CG10_big_fil_rev_8_21_14_0_10_47_8]|nr:MAG: serine esterase [Bdellovibrio sp. CG10_big_fil_rev_8_21_14_0_10_47_8]